MASLIDTHHALSPSADNRKGASLLAHLLETASITPEAEPIRAELLTLLHDMERGKGFALLPLDKELTPSQAAGALGVSRTHLMRIVQKGEIPYRMVGSHHRMCLEDVLKYRGEREKRGRALDELVSQAQELNMGY